MNLAGPQPLRLLFQGFIVIVGFLMLSGAVNTAIIGSNAVLNRVSEDGVLTDWFRAPHKKYGTTYRIINMIVILQLLAIIGSRGQVIVLGEAYAFGVIWSFSFNSLAMLVLRIKNKDIREWKVPLNIRIGNREFPFGLGIIATILFTLAGINMITKQVATISGLFITAVFFTTFLISERINEKRRKSEHLNLDQFRLQPQEAISNQTVEIRPGNTLCLVRDYTNLDYVRKALEITDTKEKDLVIMTVHLLHGPNTGYRNLNAREIFTSYEQLLFSRVVSLAEKEGKHVDLMVVPSSNVYQAIAQTAAQLHSAEIVLGHSAVLSPQTQALRLGEAWEKLPDKPKHNVCLHVITSDGSFHDFYLGAHAPQLFEDDVNLIHKLWLEAKGELKKEELHHKDIVTFALKKLEDELKSEQRQEVLEKIRSYTKNYHTNSNNKNNPTA